MKAPCLETKYWRQVYLRLSTFLHRWEKAFCKQALYIAHTFRSEVMKW
jgi:hypothetical protein